MSSCRSLLKKKPSKFSKACISVVGNPSITVLSWLYHIIVSPTLKIFLKTLHLHILQKRHLHLHILQKRHQSWWPKFWLWHLQFRMDSFHIWYKWWIAWEGVSHVMTLDLDISSRSFGLDSENRVRSVASTVLDGFFLYVAQMIAIIRGCVACYVFFQNLEILIFGNVLKIFGLDLEKKSTVLDGFFPCLAQMITGMRGCVAYNGLWPWPISSRSFGLGLENRVRSVTVASTVPDGFFFYLVQMIELAWEGVSHVMTFDLDLYLQGHSTLT